MGDEPTGSVDAAGAVLVIVFAAVILMSQTARAQTTYVITDGDRVLYHTTYATDPEEVLSEAGLELREKDTFTTQADGSEITVKRIQMIQVRTASQTVETATYGATVAEILRQLGISTQGNLRISEDLKAETYDGMVIDVITLESETEDVIRTLRYNTIYCSDMTLEPGEERVLTQGREGRIHATVRTTYENGVKTEETTLNEKILEAPVNAVIARGVDRTANLAKSSGQAESSRDSWEGGGTLTTASGEVISYSKRLSVEATAYSCRGLSGRDGAGHHCPVWRYCRGSQRDSLRHADVHCFRRWRLYLRLCGGGGLRRRHSGEYDRPVF